MSKLIRTATVATSLNILLNGQLQFLNQYFEVVAISGQDKDLIAVSNREQVKTIAVSFQRQISIIKDIISLYKLYRILKTENPLIIHSITPKAGLLSMIAGYFANVPIRMHTFTGLIFPSKVGLMQQLLITMDKLLCRFATHIYPEGEGVKKDLIQYKITSKPLKIIANGNVNGVDCDFFNPEIISENEKNALKKRLSILETDFVFIFVGRLVQDKGINELIDAFLQLCLSNSQVKLLLVGPFEQHLNPIKPETLFQIQDHKQIISVGFQDDVRPYFAISNCLVFPSYREGFPNVVLQAGAMNLPSIVTNINGSNEIILNNFNGLVIPSKDSEALFAAMKAILFDVNLHQKLKSNCRKNCVLKYSQPSVWNAILEEYKRLEIQYYNRVSKNL